MRKLALLPFGGSDDAGPADEAAPEQALAAAPVEPESLPAPLEPPPAPLNPGDLADLRRWLRRELASELTASGVLAPLLVELDPDDAPADAADDLPDASALADIAGALEADLCCATAIDGGHGAVRIRLRFAGAEGDEKLQDQEVASYEELAGVPQALARALLLAVGEDAAAPPPPDDEPIPIDATLALCRGSRQLEEAEREARAPSAESVSELRAPSVSASVSESSPRARAPAAGDPSSAISCLLEAVELAPGLRAARTRLLEEAEAAQGGPWMPAYLSALERLVALAPDDLDARIALADYRHLHLDEAGARALYLSVREQAEAMGDSDGQARALERLAALAEEAGRDDEAAQHLRAAVRFSDDQALYVRLGVALRTSSLLESMRALQRAVALDPEAPLAHLELARTLVAGGEAARAATEAARAAQQFHRDPEVSREAASFLQALITIAQGPSSE